jgi:hypothetical protein
MNGNYVPSCPSCYSGNLQPFRLSCFAFEPYPGYKHCALCGKVSAPSEIVELRALEATTRRNEVVAKLKYPYSLHLLSMDELFI